MVISNINAAAIQNNLASVLGVTPINNSTQVPSSIYDPPVNVQQINTNIDNVSSITSYSYPIERPKYYMFMGISEYSRNPNSGGEGLIRLGTTITEKIVVLPLPQQIVDQHTGDYTETAIGAVAGAGVDLASRGLGMIQGSNKNIPSSTATLSQNAQAAAVLVARGIDQFASSAGVSNVAKTGQEVLQALTGYSPNEFITILYRGPKYKRHQFTWILSARNPTESENIRRIIFILNSAMAPRLLLGGAIFGFPKIFRMGFFPNSKMLYRFKPCVLENMTIDYAGGGAGPAFYRSNDTTGLNNAPETVAIKLDFLELEYWLNRNGGWEGDKANDFDLSNLNSEITPGVNNANPTTTGTASGTPGGPRGQVGD